MYNFQKTFLVNFNSLYILEPLLSNYSEVTENGNKYIVGYEFQNKKYVDIISYNGKDFLSKLPMERFVFLEGISVYEVYPAIVRWTVLGKNILDFIKNKKSYKLFIIRGLDTENCSLVSTDNMICENCGAMFNYLEISEAGMGYILCPCCSVPIDQTGKAYKNI